ncbi:ankyrin repeat and SOCS box protein 13 isoform X4 [Mirounga angustirostris]|uniref:ankyrin repeat and SOCS box protein 13 isoform X4 n=1 Tax=Mirounga angustirostris TaxID=9716 RepID=UPI0023E39075|nr:ankyrin repeat and SOCS box protein 13 isoform X3 [Mirounga angustirostris]
MEPRGADGCFLGDVGFWVERTPVHEAAQRGETLQLQQLIESGACVNQVTVDSITPLHAASLQGQARCVQLLLAAGAQVDARNIDGSTPLCDACASGSIECVKLLLSYGAKVNPPLYTASPLHEACMSGSSECVRLLIDVGANLEAHDCHFGTPLHVACAREHLDCVKVLLNAGLQLPQQQRVPASPPDLQSVSHPGQRSQEHRLRTACLVPWDATLWKESPCCGLVSWEP